MKYLLAILMVCTTSAHAAFYDGNQLFAMMTTESDSKKLSAISYIMGSIDAYSGAVTCPPPNVTGGQVFDIVKAFLTQYPAERHKQADVLMFNLFKTVWPCAKKGQPI